MSQVLPSPRISIDNDHHVQHQQQQHHLGSDKTTETETETERATPSQQMTTTVAAIPTEVELLLLCLDHLREVRRSYPPDVLESVVRVNPNYITLACWALNKALLEATTASTTASASASDTTKSFSVTQSNDAWFDPSIINQSTTSTTSSTTSKGISIDGLPEPIPDLKTMEQEFLYSDDQIQALQLQHKQFTNNNNSNNNTSMTEKETKQGDVGDDDNEDDDNSNTLLQLYEYNDVHVSNGLRFYTLAGLASGPTIKGSLSLGEITTAGLCGLGARSRSAAETDMIASTLFEQFLEAVHAKGFFDTSLPTSTNGDGPESAMVPSENHDNNSITKQEADMIYEERYRKVVAKFRTKLATKADALSSNTIGDFLAFTAADHHNKCRIQNIKQAIAIYNDTTNNNDIHTSAMNTSVSSPTNINKHINVATPNRPLLHDKSNVTLSNTKITITTAQSPGSTTIGHLKPNQALPVQYNTLDLDEAERLKNLGNVSMQQKEYKNAVEYYTQALKLAPAGPNAHVYYSNRAAALVSMKKFHEAVIDSERSLSLKHDYGKAHARLGLAHFLLGNYRQAVEAYTVALKYEPTNQSSKNYLEKAAKRLAELGDIPNKTSLTTSYSIVSEWDVAHQNNGTNTTTTAKVPSITKPALAPNHRSTSDSNNVTVVAQPSPRQIPAQQSQSNQQHQRSLSTSSNVGCEVTLDAAHKHSSNNHTNAAGTTTTTILTGTEREAEKYKSKGNALMSNRDYNKAYDAYSRAIELCNNGIQSHVYYSNRAAALCYLERYTEAEDDSLRSLELYPTYGKAHARLGLSRFFLQNYAGAIDAYTQALQYDPDNAASKSYLTKATSRLKEQQQQQQGNTVTNATTASKTPTASTSTSGGYLSPRR